MTASTPPDTLSYGQLNAVTLDDVAPKLRAFSAELIQLLRASKIRIETTTSFLLNSTAHPIEVLCSGNGIPIQMTFDASMPHWTSKPKARLCLRFNMGRPHYYGDRNKSPDVVSLPMKKILFRCLEEIQKLERRHFKRQERARKKALAEAAFQQLADELGTVIHPDGDTIKLKNAKLKRLDMSPERVIVLLSVPYDEAREILKNHPRRR
jgi:hypothetical protein